MRNENKIKDGTTGIGAEQKVYKFDNNFGASVIRGAYTYGGEQGLWELAVIEFDGDDWGLTYETDITSDVVGYLEEFEVDALLDRIEKLDENGREL